MNGLRDLLKKKDQLSKSPTSTNPPTANHNRIPSQPPKVSLNIPEFTFIRSTTESEEVIQPPSYPGDEGNDLAEKKGKDGKKNKPREQRRTLGFRKSSNAAQTGDPTAAPPTALRASLDDATTGNMVGKEKGKEKEGLPVRPKNERRLSERLHLGGRSRSKSAEGVGSAHLPEDLPEAPEAVTGIVPAINVDSVDGEGGEEAERERERVKAENERVRLEREAAWEKRATLLASKRVTGDPSADGTTSERKSHRRHASVEQQPLPQNASSEKDAPSRDRSPSISDKPGDEDIQEAIRLHESGDVTKSTEMFGRLADPKGSNNALSQVLYGLSLRHGWGVPRNPAKAVEYLSTAASNSAAIEQAALKAGMIKGGAAKGVLVLAIFELANCFRYAWGVEKDPVAARMYYETAANLGDVDALQESAWCLVEGFGGRKDKYKAAQYLRLAEQKGLEVVGNSWIWKDKYNPK